MPFYLRFSESGAKNKKYDKKNIYLSCVK